MAHGDFAERVDVRRIKRDGLRQIHREPGCGHLRKYHKLGPDAGSAADHPFGGGDRRLWVVPPGIVLAERDGQAEGVGHSEASPRRAERNSVAPVRTISVSQLNANRMASTHCSPNASPGALPMPLAANFAESS